MKQYETVIGLEVHVELATKSKIFCGCTTAFGGQPNTHCCPVCIGMPGTLPVLNKKVVEFAIAAGAALNCKITKKNKFDRKNYFYPDLPKAYQVSQFYQPICQNGSIEIEVSGKKKIIGIHEIHMEEDAGKLIHDASEDRTLVDYNRCGIPLLEIVSEPHMRSALEVIAYLEKLKSILQYLGISDCRMQEGSLRADVNLSVRQLGSKQLGTRTEMKNMNSFKAIKHAVEGERKRQIEQLEEGKTIILETRRWDDNKDSSFAMRSKEDAMDYRYFPEPDLVPLEIDESWIKKARNSRPELRDEKMLRYETEYEIPAYDAGIITGSKTLAYIFEATVRLCKKPKEVSNWIMVETMRLLRESETDAEELLHSWEEGQNNMGNRLILLPERLAKLIDLIDDGKINRIVSKEVFEHMLKEGIEPEAYIEEHGLGMVSDDSLLRSAVDSVFAANPQSILDYKSGKDRAFGFLVGQTMKAMKGKADPAVVNRLIQERLSQCS